MEPIVNEAVRQTDSDAARRAGLLDDLRARIRGIEQVPSAMSVVRSRHEEGMDGRGGGCWRLGVPQIDDVLCGSGAAVSGLATNALHEIKPALAGDWACNHAAALGFMLRLLCRLDAPAEPGRPERAQREGAPAGAPVLWCRSGEAIREFGGLYGPGLWRLGLDPARFIIVDAARQADALWVMEEGLKSGALAAVAGLADEMALTPARRLALAAKETATPCLLLSHPRGAPAGPALTRWRVGPAASSPHAFDSGAPGAMRLRLTLERCRHGARGALSLAGCQHIVEWCDETRCFHLVAGLADRAVAAGEPACGAL